LGDGGFAMTMNGLMTAVEQDIPIITVVFNNNALGWVLHGSGPFAAEFHDWDHAAIARAMGCRGVRIEDAAGLAPALHEALATREPSVIDVRTSLKTTFADITYQLAKDASPPPAVKTKEEETS
jgi:acetolactate synthase I/II/III large subunit